MPPALFLIALVVEGFVMSLGILRTSTVVLQGLGLGLTAAGVYLNHRASGQFSAAGTAVRPFERTSQLVTGGMYSVTRNPMYLGMVLVLAGLPLVAERPLGLLVVAPFAAWMEWRFIRPEEQALERAFGKAYRGYARRVRRWI